jgi:hypothetical protein
MFGANFLRHAREFARYVRNFKYELSPDGIYFHSAKALFRGTYTHWVTGYESEIAHDHNIIPDEGLNHFLNVVLLGSPAASADFYVMLHSGTGTPTAALTAANYDATLSEIVSGSEGYSESTRVLWSPDAVDTVNTEVTNAASPAAFTIVTASSLAVNGAGLVDISTKGSTSGTLVSAGKFSATRNLANTDVFNMRYKVDFDAV